MCVLNNLACMHCSASAMLSDRRHAGLVGLSLAYALPITDRLNGILTVSAETEQEMVAVERLAEYTKLPYEPMVLPPLCHIPGKPHMICYQQTQETSTCPLGCLTTHLQC